MLIEVQKLLPVETRRDEGTLFFDRGNLHVAFYWTDSLKAVAIARKGYWQQKRLGLNPSAASIVKTFMSAVTDPWFGMDIDGRHGGELDYIEARLSESRDTFLDFAASLFAVWQPAIDNFSGVTFHRFEYAMDVHGKIYSVAAKLGLEEKCEELMARLEKNHEACRKLTL